MDILSKDAKAREEMVRFAEAMVKDSSKISKILNGDEDTLRNYETIKTDYKKAYNDIKKTDSLMAKGWKFPPIKDTLSWTTLQAKDAADMDKMVLIRTANVKIVDSLQLKLADSSLTVMQLNDIRTAIKKLNDTLSGNALNMYQLVKKNKSVFFRWAHRSAVKIDSVDITNKQIFRHQRAVFGKMYLYHFSAFACPN
ncbi:MAG: hypothetical protein IPO92_16075 [Saprospiraceae bacterium]|nr:hypothetical protein [Saprospiraceae bacterium]